MRSTTTEPDQGAPQHPNRPRINQYSTYLFGAVDQRAQSFRFFCERDSNGPVTLSACQVFRIKNCSPETFRRLKDESVPKRNLIAGLEVEGPEHGYGSVNYNLPPKINLDHAPGLVDRRMTPGPAPDTDAELLQDLSAWVARFWGSAPRVAQLDDRDGVVFDELAGVVAENSRSDCSISAAAGRS
jgi:hypothetical protein